MDPVNGALGDRLAALRSDFAALGTRAGEAAAGLTATLPPPSALLDELTAAGQAFVGFRSVVVEYAGTLSITLDAENLGTLRDLEPVLAAITAAEEHRTRLAAWDTARKDALGVLGRVMGLTHREDKTLPTLTECQGRARELHVTLAGPAPEGLEGETRALPDKMRPYAELLALIEGWNVLDDDRCAELQDAISASFGRTLALAALRGKLGREGEVPPPPPRTRARKPAAEPPAPVPRVAVTPAPRLAPPSAPAPAPVAAVPPTLAPPPPPPPPSRPVMPPAPASAPRAVPEPPRAPAVSPAAAASGAPARVPDVPDVPDVPVHVGDVAAAADDDEAGGALLENPGLSGDAGESPAARREREAELERLAQETARWWIAARTGWQGLRERGLNFGDATHDYLERYPYLLSVPIQKSTEYENGRLAEGYALLLAHIDKQEQGFVKDALLRLNPQFGSRDQNQAYPLGQELYLFVVAEGRLYKTYPDFVREVVHHAVPKPGAWVQGGIVDADNETRLFMRSERPGSTEEQTRTLTDSKERLGPHLFRVTLGPLTTRFFTLRLAGEALADPPNVEIKLKENDAPTDHAWLVTLPAAGKAPTAAPRKHRTGGTTLEELGKQFNGFWMGIFNADPSHDRNYELSIILRRKPPPVSGPNAKPAPVPDRFFGKKK
jgi:hypothetical protein